MTQIKYADIDYVVGIDFGNSFSSASYAFIRDDAQKCCHIANWHNHKYYIDNQKIPTICLFDIKLQEFIRWSRDALEYYKDHSKRQQQKNDIFLVKHFHEELRNTLESKSDSTDYFYRDAAVYFLRQMIQYTRKAIDDDVPRDTKHPVLLYVLSLPSNWSAVARNEMKKLFYKSILKKDEHFEIIEQSLATALFCQNNEDKKITFAPGESHLICDLGGETSNFALFESGTRDNNKDNAQTFEIFKTPDNQNVEFMISFGSSHIDKKMNEYIAKLLFNNDANAIAKNSKVIRHLMGFFTCSVKPFFGEVVEEAVSLPMLYAEVIKPSIMLSLTNDGVYVKGKLQISYKDMCTHVFDPVVDRIITSMENITSEKSIGAVNIITSRYSGSSYLVSKIEKRLEQDNIKNITMTRKEHSVAMDGAVFYGLNKVNTTRNNLK